MKISCKFNIMFAAILVLIGLTVAAFLAPVADVAFADAPKIDAKAYYLADYDSGEVIMKHNENARLPIASMTKIMTSLLAFEAVERGELFFDEEIEVSENAASMGGSQVFLDANTKHTADNLLKSIVVASANDSCVAIAERLSGSVGAFVADMNDRAAELGMKNTHFANCTGLPAAENFSCARDVAVMFGELIRHPEYFEYAAVWSEDYVHPDGRLTNMTNTNKLVRFYNGCDGGKTGFTSEAKFCLSATAKRGDMRLISVVIGADSSKSRFGAVSGMFNEGFDNYENKTVLKGGEILDRTVAGSGGKQKSLKIKAERNLSAFAKRGDKSEFEVVFDLPSKVKAGISEGDVIGNARLVKNGEVVKEVQIIAAESVAKANIFDILQNIGDKWNRVK